MKKNYERHFSGLSQRISVIGLLLKSKALKSTFASTVYFVKLSTKLKT